LGNSLRSATDQRNSFIAPAGTSAALPHVVVLLPNQPEREVLLCAIGNDARVTVVEPERAIPNLEVRDVALLHVDCLSLTSSPLLYDPALGCPELVFVVDQAWSPQHLALKSRGCRNVLLATDQGDVRDRRSAAEALKGQLSSAISERARVVEVECATALCKAVIEEDTGAHPEMDTSTLVESTPFLKREAMFGYEREGTRKRTVIYAARDGHSLAAARGIAIPSNAPKP